MTEWLESKELDRVWKESVMPTFPVLSWHFPGENEENNEKSVKKVGALAEIRIRHLPNRGQKNPHRLGQLAWSEYTDNSPTYATVTFRKTWSKAKFAQVGIEYANGQLNVHIKEVQPTSKPLEPERPQYDRSAACVIAQQYSTVTSVSLHFHSHKKKLGARLKKCYFIS
jgi:hypothetical protein